MYTPQTYSSSTPYADILRRRIKIQSHTRSKLDRMKNQFQSQATLTEIRSAFINFINHGDAHGADAVMRGFAEQLGPMPFSPKTFRQIRERAAQGDASWDFASSEYIAAFSWVKVLPESARVLGEALDQAPGYWWLMAVHEAATPAGQKFLRHYCSLAMQHEDVESFQDTTSENLSRMAGLIENALSVLPAGSVEEFKSKSANRSELRERCVG